MTPLNQRPPLAVDASSDRNRRPWWLPESDGTHAAPFVHEFASTEDPALTDREEPAR